MTADVSTPPATRTVRTFLAVAGAALVATACGSAPLRSVGFGPETLYTAPAALTGQLTVFAAASLTEAFNDAKTSFARSAPSLNLTYEFAGSQTLVTQVSNGAAADVIATADATTMNRLVAAGLVETPRQFARNRLEMVVAPRNPKGVRTLADLARTDLAVVLADPSVPAGGLAKEVLQTAGITVSPRSLELDVKSVLSKVELGEADAALVYTTDVTAARSLVAGVVIPEAQNMDTVYPIAVVTASAHQAAAEAFVDAAVSGPVQAFLQARGFAAP